MNFFTRDLAEAVAPPRPVVEWEEADCLLCGGRTGSPLVESPDTGPGGTGLWFAVVQCQECGLCYTNPRPSTDSIGQFYSPQYGPHRSRKPRPDRRRRWFGAWGHQSCKERHLLPLHGLGRLLDFGCGSGSYLERMSRQGWQVTGIDISATAVEHIRKELRLTALLGSLPHPELRPRSFDVVTMWHSLEHVHQPVRVLREAHRLLAPGGRLIVAVPNIDSLAFRWFGSAWYGLDLPRHLTHFAPWTLQLMLERVGFRVGPIRMVRHSDWLRCSARLACRTPRGPHWHRWLTGKLLSRLATWYSYVTKQCDCVMVTAER